MVTFTKYTLSFLGFCALQMLFFVPLAGMQEREEIKADFLKKVEEGNVAGVKELIKAGKISQELLLDGFSKLDVLIAQRTVDRDQKTEGSEDWKRLNELCNSYQAISEYIGSIGFQTLKFYHSQVSTSSSSAAHSGNAAAVSSEASSMSCLSSSSFVPVESSSSQAVQQNVFSSTSSVPMIAVQSSSGLSSIAEVAEENFQQHGVMMSLAPADSSLIPDAEEHSTSMHAAQRSNCFYRLMQTLICFCTAAFIKEKSM